MLGAIIGDIVGSRYEFNPTNDYNFEMFAEGSDFTDDTVCTIAVADALLRGRDYGESIHEWCRKYPNPKGGYGGRFRQWVMSDNPKPYGSFGNGSAMRVSPIGWWYDDPRDLIEQATKSAECTHNHEYGIDGAIAVVAAIADCREMRRKKDVTKLTPKEILEDGLSHATFQYVQYTDQFHVDLEAHCNKFDETCQGTVPVALWIVMHSTGFEDAIRRAVSLGADADTLGAIVGSIAEAIWGIPEWIKKKAMSYLPKDMLNVVKEFHRRLNVRRELSRKCEFYRIDGFVAVLDQDKPALEIEKEWVEDLAKTYRNADKIKSEMVKLCDMSHWQEWADEYGLPVSLIGYIFKHTADCGMFMHERVEPFQIFLLTHYSKRKERIAQEREEEAKLDQFKAVMRWKLGLGNFNKLIEGESPIPAKNNVATRESWKVEPMPDGDDVSRCEVKISVPSAVMEILRRGHIPEVQEDHWFMYVDDSHIRYHRSWTGMCAFEAHYRKIRSGNYIIDSLSMNKALAEFGVNGDMAGVALFQYLLTAEVGGDAERAWQQYLDAWTHLHRKYSNKTN